MMTEWLSATEIATDAGRGVLANLEFLQHATQAANPTAISARYVWSDHVLVCDTHMPAFAAGSHC
jgi:hypothetical protein